MLVKVLLETPPEVLSEFASSSVPRTPSKIQQGILSGLLPRTPRVSLGILFRRLASYFSKSFT